MNYRSDSPSLSDLSQSIFASLGLTSAVNSLALAPARRTCLLLVDGLGAHGLARYGDQFPIFAQLNNHGELASHFPTTTVTNLTSLGTGVEPGVHGMLGYTVKVPGSGTPGRLLNALKWDEKVDPLIWQRTPTLFERARDAGLNVSTVGDKRYADTGFTQASLRGATYLAANHIPEMVSAAKSALAEPNSFVYVYTNILDHAGHNFGEGSEQWLIALKTVADLVTRLVNELPRNARFYLTADHGMVNAGEKIILGESNPLMNNVTLVGGEPRMRHIYLESGSENEAVATWREYLGDRAMVYTKRDAIAAGLFGGNVSDVSDVSDASVDRIGDLLAIAHYDYVLIDPARSVQESSIIGQHGGLTPEERDIPLLGILI